MKRNLSTIILILVFFTGLSLLLYPSVSDYWNSLHQSRAIATYAEAVAEIGKSDYDHLWQAAREYNRRILSRPKAYAMSEEEQLALLATDGMLVKRPILVGDDFVLTGFRQAEWETKLK